MKRKSLARFATPLRSILLTGERPATSETDTPCIGFICSAAMVCFLSSLCLAAFEVTMIVTQRSPTTAINGPLAYDRESRGRRPHFYTSATAKHTPIYFEVLICARRWASLDAAYYLSALALGGCVIGRTELPVFHEKHMRLHAQVRLNEFPIVPCMFGSSGWAIAPFARVLLCHSGRFDRRPCKSQAFTKTILSVLFSMFVVLVEGTIMQAFGTTV